MHRKRWNVSNDFENKNLLGCCVEYLLCNSNILATPSVSFFIQIHRYTRIHSPPNYERDPSLCVCVLVWLRFFTSLFTCVIHIVLNGLDKICWNCTDLFTNQYSEKQQPPPIRCDVRSIMDASDLCCSLSTSLSSVHGFAHNTKTRRTTIRKKNNSYTRSNEHTDEGCNDSESLFHS